MKKKLVIIMPEEDWEIVPHQILAELRDEVHVLKEKLSQPTTKLDMVEAMNDLKKSIQDMHAIFQTALEQTGKEADISQRLSALEKQNERIIQTLSTFADSMDGKADTAPRMFQSMPPMSLPNMPNMQMPSQPSMPASIRASRVAPPPMRAPPSRAPSMSSMPEPPSFGIPPPPPAPKKGLFGKILR